ncbi:hypothetical protein [Mesorhizobium sp. M0578]|uniref:hypothetical protein n=1 Tax=unclassified Mesorhizobium TaxID=325217 RepID=UPI00333C5A8B
MNRFDAKLKRTNDVLPKPDNLKSYRQMGDDKPNRERLKEAQAKGLAEETGITESQASDLIEMIGTDRASLVREARILKKRQTPPAKS